MKKNDLVRIIEKTGGKVLNSVNFENVYQISLVSEENTFDENSNFSEFKGNSLYSHKWILDSISNARLLKPDQYSLV